MLLVNATSNLTVCVRLLFLIHQLMPNTTRRHFCMHTRRNKILLLAPTWTEPGENERCVKKDVPKLQCSSSPSSSSFSFLFLICNWPFEEPFFFHLICSSSSFLPWRARVDDKFVFFLQSSPLKWQLDKWKSLWEKKACACLDEWKSQIGEKTYLLPICPT